MPDVDSSILSLVALIIATASTLISYQLYRLQRDPEVVVYATGDDRPTIIVLIIENTGGSVALDVTFDSSIPISRAYGFGTPNDPEPEVMSAGPLVRGVPSLGPSARRVINWGQYGGLYKALGDSTFDVTATYYSSPFLRLFRRKHTTVSRIDIRSFELTDDADRNWDQKTAEALKKLSDAITPLGVPARKLLAMRIREKEAEKEDPRQTT